MEGSPKNIEEITTSVRQPRKSTREKEGFKNFKGSTFNQEDTIFSKLAEIKNVLLKKGKITEEEYPVSYFAKLLTE
jgi:hypothetical protein